MVEITNCPHTPGCLLNYAHMQKILENMVKTKSLGLVNLVYLGMYSSSTHTLTILWKPYCPKVPAADHKRDLLMSHAKKADNTNKYTKTGLRHQQLNTIEATNFTD